MNFLFVDDVMLFRMCSMAQTTHVGCTFKMTDHGGTEPGGGVDSDVCEFLVVK